MRLGKVFRLFEGFLFKGSGVLVGEYIGLVLIVGFGR